MKFMKQAFNSEVYWCLQNDEKMSHFIFFLALTIIMDSVVMGHVTW